LKRILVPSISSPVYFCDVILADILTSFAKVLGDLWVSACQIWWGGITEGRVAQSGWSRYITLAMVWYVPVSDIGYLPCHTNKPAFHTPFVSVNVYSSIINHLTLPLGHLPTPSNTFLPFRSSSSPRFKRQSSPTWHSKKALLSKNCAKHTIDGLANIVYSDFGSLRSSSIRCSVSTGM
jgi:hypothetical protein